MKIHFFKLFKLFLEIKQFFICLRVLSTVDTQILQDIQIFVTLGYFLAANVYLFMAIV